MQNGAAGVSKKGQIMKVGPVLAAVALLTFTSTVGYAAVRTCGVHISSALSHGPDEQSAKKLALDDWTKKAIAAGFETPLWRTAANKILKCAPVANGAFECIAYAEPCAVQQNPNAVRRPPPKKIGT